MTLVGRQQVPAWIVVIILCRELAVTGLRALAADQNVIIAAEAYGKFKMLFLIAGAFLLILNFPELYWPGMVALGIGLLLGLVSGIDYLRKYLSQIL